MDLMCIICSIMLNKVIAWITQLQDLLHPEMLSTNSMHAMSENPTEAISQHMMI